MTTNKSKKSYGCTTTQHGFKISNGNAKMGNVPSFSVPAVTTCPKNAPCYKKCYVKHFFKNVLATYDNNYNRLVKKNGYAVAIADINEYLDNGYYPLFRWNVSGDVFSTDYYHMMVEIAESNTDTKFLVFTKQYEIVHAGIKLFGKPDNLVVYVSVWDTYQPSVGTLDGLKKAYFVPKKGNVCVPTNVKECSGNCAKCRICFNNKFNVTFKEH